MIVITSECDFWLFGPGEHRFRYYVARIGKGYGSQETR